MGEDEDKEEQEAEDASERNRQWFKLFRSIMLQRG